MDSKHPGSGEGFDLNGDVAAETPAAVSITGAEVVEVLPPRPDPYIDLQADHLPI